MKTCEDCGSRVYGGHCTNCHEEVFIMKQHIQEPCCELSDEFRRKVKDQLDNPTVPKERLNPNE